MILTNLTETVQRRTIIEQIKRVFGFKKLNYSQRFNVEAVHVRTLYA